MITFEMAQEEITKLGYKYPEAAFSIIMVQQQIASGIVPGDETAAEPEPVAPDG